MRPTRYAIDDNIPEKLDISPDQPSPSDWDPYDEWRMQSKRPKDPSFRYWNSRYRVTVTEAKQSLLKCKCWKMLIIRADQSAHHDYRDYQRIKDDIFGPEAEALELYPARSREVDPSNAFILYVFDKRRIPIGVPVKNVCTQDRSLAPQRRFEGPVHWMDIPMKGKP